MNYEEMSDFEINSAAYNFALSLGYDLTFLGDDVIEWRKDGDVITTVKVDYTKNGLRDYCNNPSDAWPIIMENKIDVQHRDGFNVPCAKHCEHMSAHKHPLRAAMIVYLMMQEAKRG